MVFWSCLLSLFLWLRVPSANAVGWNIEVPESVVGLSGSCVLIPCRFSYPENGKTYTEFKGIWLKGNEESTVFHTDTSNIIDSFKGRTSLNETPENPNVSVEEEVTSGKPVTATCAVSHSCPSDLPKVTWSHDGKQSSPSQPQNHGQWKLTSYNLTFTPSREDHNKHLSCTAEFKGKTLTDYKTLKVKYPPYNVNVVPKSSVKENDFVELTCSSNSNPPANSYQWFSSDGKMLAESPTYKLKRVSEAISCTAINTEGKNNSGPQKFNILYPPEIKSESSCQSKILTVCVCIVDSNPPSEVKWFGPDSSKAFSSTSSKQNEFTLQGWLGFPETVQCFANNSLGSSNITLEAPQNRIIIYIAVGSAVVVVLVCILVYVVRRRCGKRAAQQPVMKNEQTQKTTQNKSDLENKEVKGSDEDIYTNCSKGRVYDNWGKDLYMLNVYSQSFRSL
uniref:Si:dkey-238d18.5 n=1 Tax=Cyprinus carpio carpio TaxID=630221 RepID=A0A8C1H6I7_CYPCA